MQNSANGTGLDGCGRTEQARAKVGYADTVDCLGTVLRSHDLGQILQQLRDNVEILEDGRVTVKQDRIIGQPIGHGIEQASGILEFLNNALVDEVRARLQRGFGRLPVKRPSDLRGS